MQDSQIAGGAVRDFVRDLALNDPLARHLGITCIDAGPGRATVRMQVGALHLNFNGSCHGGAIFALADTAFGLASNSHGILAAGIDAHIAFPAPARCGEVLTAAALELSRSRRLAIYRVEVHAGSGTLVSVFTGTVYITGKPTAAVERTALGPASAPFPGNE